jgi:hypothetical protein
MKTVPAIITVVSVMTTVWLGASFSMNAEPDPMYRPPWSGDDPDSAPFVEASHPDSHRLGQPWTSEAIEDPKPAPHPDGSAIQTTILDLASADPTAKQ